MVPDAAWPGSDQWPWSTAPAPGPVGWLGPLSASNPWGVGSFLSLGRPTCVRCPGPLGSCSPVCRWVCCVACAASWATWLLFTGAPAQCVALRVRCPGPLGSCSSACLLCLLFCLCGVLGDSAPVHRCARSVRCSAGAVSWASWHLFTGVLGRGVPSLCCPRCMCVCGVLAHVAPVHRCARCVRCARAVGSWVPLPPPLIFVFFSSSVFFL